MKSTFVLKKTAALLIAGTILSACLKPEPIDFKQQSAISIGTFSYPDHFPKNVTLPKGLDGQSGPVTMPTGEIFRKTLEHEFKRAGLRVNDDAPCIVSGTYSEFTLTAVDEDISKVHNDLKITIQRKNGKKTELHSVGKVKILDGIETVNIGHVAHSILRRKLVKFVVPTGEFRRNTGTKTFTEFLQDRCAVQQRAS